MNFFFELLVSISSAENKLIFAEGYKKGYESKGLKIDPEINIEINRLQSIVNQ